MSLKRAVKQSLILLLCYGILMNFGMSLIYLLYHVMKSRLPLFKVCAPTVLCYK